MIPEAAVEAAVEAHCEGTMLAALEAAYPILLSHEMEETRLAHVDAVANAESLGRYEAAVLALRDLADNAERDRDYVKVVDASAIHAAIDEALNGEHIRSATATIV